MLRRAVPQLAVELDVAREPLVETSPDSAGTAPSAFALSATILATFRARTHDAHGHSAGGESGRILQAGTSCSGTGTRLPFNHTLGWDSEIAAVQGDKRIRLRGV